MSVRRGEIYWVDYEPVKGSEQGGIRPALVVQNDIGNANSPTTVVVAITRTIPRRPYPFTVIVEPEDTSLPERGTVICSQLNTVFQAEHSATRLRPPRGEAVVRPIGRLGEGRMREVEQALRYNLGLG
jgi:mRNA interferase MazF